MTTTPVSHCPMTDEEVERATQKAKTALVAALAHIVDLGTLRDGDSEFAYFVNVPASDIDEITQRIAEAEYDVNAQFGVWVRVLPIPSA